MSEKNYNDLISALMNYSLDEGDYHSDRQLADEILLADGWEVKQDSDFAGGIVWSKGTWPRQHIAEPHRPHPINSLDDAIMLIPDGYSWFLKVTPDQAIAAVCRKSRGKTSDWGLAGYDPRRPAMALTIAALKSRFGYMLKEKP